MVVNYSTTKMIQQINIAYKWYINRIERNKKILQHSNIQRNGLIMNLAFLYSKPCKYNDTKIGNETNQNKTKAIKKCFDKKNDNVLKNKRITKTNIMENNFHSFW